MPYGGMEFKMQIRNDKAEDVKITYIGGGSRGWVLSQTFFKTGISCFGQ